MTLPWRGQAIRKEQLEQLYLREHLSMAEIAEALNCSVNKVVYWMNRHAIPRRHRDEASYVKHNPEGDPFKIKNLETDDERALFHLGVGLYIGEGTKSRHRVSISNADPQVIRAFLRFLRQICQVEEKKIFAWLNIFDDVNLEEAQAYWEQVTGLPRTQFYKPIVRSGKKGSYQTKSRYGTLTVGVSNTKLANQIREWYKTILEAFGS